MKCVNWIFTGIILLDCSLPVSFFIYGVVWSFFYLIILLYVLYLFIGDVDCSFSLLSMVLFIHGIFIFFMALSVLFIFSFNLGSCLSFCFYPLCSFSERLSFLCPFCPSACIFFFLFIHGTVCFFNSFSFMVLFIFVHFIHSVICSFLFMVFSVLCSFYPCVVWDFVMSDVFCFIYGVVFFFFPSWCFLVFFPFIHGCSSSFFVVVFYFLCPFYPWCCLFFIHMY